MDVKSNLIKSKSSNVALKTESRNKKSKSNAEFQPAVVKKRGVYVENKFPNSISTYETAEIEQKLKAPPRPRPGQKKFLASVLTILSKSSAGTQYPDIQDIQKEQIDNLKQIIKEKKRERRPHHKKKFKSRVLNEEMLRNEQDELVVLKSGKDIVQTPSNLSAISQNKSEKYKLSEPAHTSNRTSIRDILENNIYSGVAEGKAKEILEEKKTMRPLRINDDPDTMASAIAEKDDSKMYNFFVDLLKTTFSVYNVNPTYEKMVANEEINTETKVHDLEASDPICKKLLIQDTEPDVFVRQSNHYTINDVHDDFLGYDDHALMDFTPTEKIKRKMRTRSFFKPKKIKPLPKTASVNSKKVTWQEKLRIKKNRFINDLKKQLENDDFYIEEPKNIFEALQQLARNKRRNTDYMYSYERPQVVSELDNKDCVFRTRNVVFAGRKRRTARRRRLPSIISTDSEYMMETERPSDVM